MVKLSSPKALTTIPKTATFPQKAALISERLARASACLAVIIAASACASTGVNGGTGTAKSAGGPAKAPVFRSSDIDGKSAADLDALLGAADLARVEGEGEFRRYALAQCSLLIILYPDEKGVRRASSVSAGALGSADAPPDLDACLAAGRAPAQ